MEVTHTRTHTHTHTHTNTRIYTQVEGSVYFSPTRLASSLCGGSGGGDAQSTANADIAGGHIIVESNFKVGIWSRAHTDIAERHHNDEIYVMSLRLTQYLHRHRKEAP